MSFLIAVGELGIFDRFRKKKSKNESLYSDPSAVAKAERTAMANENLNEAINLLVQIYKQC